MDGSGNARIMDFGLASVVRDPGSMGSISDIGHTPRWTAPEILRYGTLASRESDIFSFAMVIFEVRGCSALGVSTTLFVDSGPRRASSVPWCPGASGSSFHRGWETSTTARSPQTHGCVVGIN